MLQRICDICAAVALLVLIHLFSVVLMVWGLWDGLCIGASSTWPYIRDSWAQLWGVIRDGR